MYRSIIILISLVCIILGKPKMGDDGYYYHSPYLTEDLRKNTSSLLDFETIASTIKDTLELVEFYQALSEELYIKSLSLDSDYFNTLKDYELLLRFYEKEYGYKPEYFIDNINSSENLNAFLNAGYTQYEFQYYYKPIKITSNSIDNKLHFYQLQIMRDQFIDQYNWMKENILKRKNYIQFMKDNLDLEKYYDPKYFSKYLNYEQLQSIEELLRFETIAKGINDPRERAKYYRAVAEGLYLKTREMSDQFGKSFGGYTKIIQEMERDFGYATRTVIYDEFEKMLQFSPVKLSDRSIAKRLNYYQALILRDQYIKLYRWTKTQVNDRKKYLSELENLGPPVIFYVDENPYITKYKFPLELSKNLLVNARNNIDSLLNFQNAANRIIDPPERAKYYSSISEALTVKTMGLEMEFEYISAKFLSMIRFYETKLGYGNFIVQVDKPFSAKGYKSIAITDSLLSDAIHYKQATIMASQYAIINEFYSSKLAEYRKQAVFLKADYYNRRHEIPEYDEKEIISFEDEEFELEDIDISGLDEYEFDREEFNEFIENFELEENNIPKDYSTNNLIFNDEIPVFERYEFISPFLPDSIRFNISKLLHAENIAMQISDSLDQAIFYRAVTEAIYIHLQALDIRYYNTHSTYSSILNNYEYNLGYIANFNFSGSKPWSNVLYEPLRIKDYTLHNKMHYQQMGILREHYIQTHDFYKDRYNDYKTYLRILKSDEARLKIAEKQTNLNPDDLIFKEIFSSPYFTIEMMESEDMLLDYLFTAEEILNPLERAEFYRTISEAFYWKIKNASDNFMSNQIDYRRTIKELEKNYGEKIGKVKGRKIIYNETFSPVIVLQGTIKMQLHEKHARMMEKEYKKMFKKINKHTTLYTDYIDLLKNSIAERDQNERAQKLADLSRWEQVSRLKNSKIEFYIDELYFLQGIQIGNIKTYNSDYIRVERNIISDISNMIWYDKKGKEKKIRKFIYKDDGELSRTVESQDGKTKNITWYETEALGETFFDFAYHIDLSKVSKNYFKEIHFNNFNSVQEVNLYATSGSTLGIIDYSYNENGKLEGLIWYLGDREKKIKEISLINANPHENEVVESPES